MDMLFVTGTDNIAISWNANAIDNTTTSVVAGRIRGAIACSESISQASIK